MLNLNLLDLRFACVESKGARLHILTTAGDLNHVYFRENRELLFSKVSFRESVS